VPVGDPVRAWVPVLELLDATDDEMLARHGRWYIAERDPKYLRRNALIVLGNVGRAGNPAVRATLERYLAHPDPMLRAHAVWSARRLGCDDLTMALASDPDPQVREELHAP
jgi:epoxyqueuosine reductase